MSYIAHSVNGVGFNPDNVDVWVYNRNENEATSATSNAYIAASPVILPGQLVCFTIADQAIITGDGLTPAIGHSRKANIFGNVSKSYTSTTAGRAGLFGVALERGDVSYSTSAPTSNGAPGQSNGCWVRVRGVVKAYVRSHTSTASTPGYALTADVSIADSGYLTVGNTSAAGTSAGTRKVLGLTLESSLSSNFTSVYGQALQYVLFDGINGFGGSNNLVNL